ncbi:hypothetical protein SE17_14025 [Kouleothrix aurantiaca]|uniref:Phospholipase n=1 Tax=Kouleothrix aurantiaca TaxID=186479 RepID=A0A0P9D191_9CHLR|nr:hypothetical protein SE17_14025 [Kouleothrix aurantiaca]
MDSKTLAFTHQFIPARAADAPTLLLLHGTGGNEHDLLGLGQALHPQAALLSPRGQVLENGMPRFFRRLAEGVFDLDDLRRRTDANVTYTTVGAGEQRLFIYNSGDGYDAARLLLSDVLSGWARDLPGQLVIGIPNRDFLIAFSDANPEILRAVAAQVQADAAQQQYGLTEQLFTLEQGVVKEYSWE